jgi:hypothetical protein
MAVSAQLETGAGIALSETLFAPCEAPKPDPEIVT